MMLRILLSIVISIVLIAPSSGAQIDVSISGFAFGPANVSILVGDTVRWTNNDPFSHTSTSGTGTPPSPDGNWNSGTISSSGHFDHVFAGAGSFPYYCGFHTSMRGSVTVVAPTTVGQAKALPDSTTAGLQGVVITALASGGFYVESVGRSAGILVNSTFAGSRGQVVDVIGVVSASAGKKSLSASSVRLSGDQGKSVGALAMSNRSTAGLPETEGLLVRVWGRATPDQGADYFVLDDGSALGGTGLKIASGSLTKPDQGTYVVVTGISSFEGSPSARIIVPREQSDIVTAP